VTLTSLAGTSGRLCDPPPPLFRSDGRNECEPTRCLRRVTASSSAASTVCNGENAMIPLERTARAGADLGGGGPEGPQYHRPRQSCKAPLRLRAQTPLRRTRPGPGRPGTHPGPGRCCFLPSRLPLGLPQAEKNSFFIFLGFGNGTLPAARAAGKVRDERRESARPLPPGRNSSGKVRATRKVREGEGVGALCPVLCVRAWTPAERLLVSAGVHATNALQASMQASTHLHVAMRWLRVTHTGVGGADDARRARAHRHEHSGGSRRPASRLRSALATSAFPDPMR